MPEKHFTKEEWAKGITKEQWADLAVFRYNMLHFYESFIQEHNLCVQLAEYLKTSGDQTGGERETAYIKEFLAEHISCTEE